MLAIRQQICNKGGGIDALTSTPLTANEGKFVMAKRFIKQLPENINVPDGAKAIPLTKGTYAIVDEEDYEHLNRWNWYISKLGSNGYAVRRKCWPGSEKIYMHRETINAPDDVIVDHINGCSLDNRKSNLRICTQSGNCRNRRPITGLEAKGVRLLPTGSWEARIWVDNKRLNLGIVETKEEAIVIYNEAAKKYYGEFAYINDFHDEEILKKALGRLASRFAETECPECGKQFKKSYIHHKYCNVKCKILAQNRRNAKRRRNKP